MQSHHPGTVFRHHSGRVYTLIAVANVESTDQEKFPLTAVYQGSNGKTWSRPMKDFVKKFTVLFDGTSLA